MRRRNDSDIHMQSDIRTKVIYKVNDKVLPRNFKRDGRKGG